MKSRNSGFHPVERPNLPPLEVHPEHYTEIIEDPAFLPPQYRGTHAVDFDETQPEPYAWQAGLLEETLHNQMLADASWKDSMRMTGQALRSDYNEYGNRFLAASRIGGIILTQGLDRSRIPFIVVPGAITKAYAETNSSLVAGAAGFGAFALWSRTVSSALARNMEHFPKTVNTFTRAFPGFTSFFTENLPGLERTKSQPYKSSEQGYIRRALEMTKQLGKRALSAASIHVQRGVAGIGLGSTAYVASTIANGKGKKEALDAGRRLTLDTATIIGTLGVAVTLGLEKLADNGYPDTAKWIDDWIVSSSKFWGAVGLGSIYLNYRINKSTQESDAPRMLSPKLRRPQGYNRSPKS